MSTDRPLVERTRPPDRADPGATRVRRDAANTRELLISAGRRRFARDGYQPTTVRDVAADAGVNVALINRYFVSKEGLFEACMPRAVEVLDTLDSDATSFEDLLPELVKQVARSLTDDGSLQLLLLLRSSGDEHADRIRRSTLRGFARHLAAVAGWREADPATEHLELRAEIALSTILGVVILRASTALEPLASTPASDLSALLSEAITALLRPPSS